MDMRVSGVYNTYSAQPTRLQTSSRLGKGRNDTDKVSLSAQAGDYQTARNAIAQAPDIRENLVGRIQEMLDAGSYRVTAQEVAESIFREL